VPPLGQPKNDSELVAAEKNSFLKASGKATSLKENSVRENAAMVWH